MATETASQTARYTFIEDGTLTVTGRGQCIVKVVGNTWGGGTMSLLDDVCVADEFKAVDIDGTAITLNTGSRTYYLEGYHPSDRVQLQLSLASSTSPDIDVYVSFDFPPAI